MKIGDRVFVRGYVDEIRKDTVIVRNDGGYFGTIPSEVITGELPSAQPDSKELSSTHKALDTISRQAALNALSRGNGCGASCHRAIKALPSAQPDVPDTNVGDMISRRAAVSICDNAIDLWNGQLGAGALVAVRDAIKALPSADIDLSDFSDKLWKTAYERGKAEAVRWIPASERLPNNELAIVQYSDNDFDLLQFPTAYRWKDIVAWMPLPEPYKDGEQDG